jgi:enterochelin esterase-like enzyme
MRRNLLTVCTVAASLFAAEFLGLRSTLLAQSFEYRSARQVLGMPFRAFVAKVEALKTRADRTRTLDTLIAKTSLYGHPLTEDSTVILFFSGHAARVAVPSDLNGWRPADDIMKRIGGTDFFYLEKTVDPAARFEYKLMVDSLWILDPYNRQTATGGFGPNSEIWMPAYRPPRDIESREGISHGTIDTLWYSSKILGRTHPVLVYLPPGFSRTSLSMPTVFVADGGEYLSLARMNVVLDNMIADGRIRPIIGIFVDPRTDPLDSRTSTRMTDYGLSDAFLAFLTDELRPYLTARYPIAVEPDQCAIMGASLGGLIATYAAYRRPDVFGLCAAQSPAYQYLHDSIFTIVGAGERKPFRMHLTTGTIRDAREGARRMKSILDAKGYVIRYQEFPESHNWVNWRARLSDILTYFWGTP